MDDPLHKKLNQDFATKQKIDLCEIKRFAYVLIYLKVFKTVHKNIPRTHSPQQNKKAVLMTAAYFYVRRDSKKRVFPV